MANDSYKRIDRLLNTAERRIARIFRAAIFALRDDLDLDEIATLIARRDFEGALQLMVGVAEELGAASNAMFVTAGQDTATFLRDAGVATISFDQVNQRAVNTMRANNLRLIREFSDTQRRAIREVMIDTIARGLPPAEQARQFREVVGLTRKQAAAVRNYRRLLEGVDDDGFPSRTALQRKLRDKRSDKAVLAAIRDKRPLSKEHIDSMVGRYAKRYVAHRAMVIARTESLRSVHQGVEQAYTQAIESGAITADQIEQKWVSARDGRVRDSHNHLNGQKRKWGETWQGLHGTLRYPGDSSAPAAEVINCRCVVTRRILPKEQAQLPGLG